MAMGTRRKRQRQEELWYRRDLAEAPGHPFYRRLNEVLDQAGFDEFCEARCHKFYQEKLGRPSLAPGMYFRAMLIGFFEGIESERGIAWRVADSLCLREFLQIGLDERTPDHVTISRTRRLMDGATHQEVFGWVLRQVARAGLLRGKTIGIDATTLEANAAMKSIVRRDPEESYIEYLKRLAEAAGLEATDEAALRRMDRRRRKKGSNEEWVNPHDPEAEITRMKDGRTLLAYKAEHAVDMDTGAIVAVTTHGGAEGDTTSVGETLPAAGEAIAEHIAEPTTNGKFEVNAKGLEELVADKGYHSRDVLVDLQGLRLLPARSNLCVLNQLTVPDAARSLEKASERNAETVNSAPPQPRVPFWATLLLFLLTLLPGLILSIVSIGLVLFFFNRFLFSHDMLIGLAAHRLRAGCALVGLDADSASLPAHETPFVCNKVAGTTKGSSSSRLLKNYS